MEVDTEAGVSSRAERKALEKAKIVQRENERNVLKMVTRIMKKAEDERTEEETCALLRHRDAVEELRKRRLRSSVLKRKQEEVKHVVSQNCDGLHLRSGLPRHALSELHGNMFIEVCTSCTPAREYVRVFDVTERTSLRRHGTGRRCARCTGDLRDTIVLKKYACLWCMNRPAKTRPKLYIVNLQWTPKDDLATLKMNGKCDDVLNLLMKDLDIQIPQYNKAEDPILSLAIPLRLEEEQSHSRSLIAPPAGQEDCSPDAQGPATGKPVQGGWFGRGYSKARRKKKKAI
ncbi:hypothetical protein CRUP_002997 [Coryphaenoides rupestris]|nr:hypothetical protein CRUP_002997 [Coryphaenoides rupestris]